MFAVLFRFEPYDLQDAGVGDVRDYVRHSLPHPQQSSAQHVILPETHAQKTLVPLLDLLTLALPMRNTDIHTVVTGKFHEQNPVVLMGINEEFSQMVKKFAYAFTFFYLLAFACEIMQSDGKCDHNFRHNIDKIIISLCILQ